MDSLSLWTQDDNTPQRQCKNCKQTFPLTSDFFSIGRRNKGGFIPVCKVCISEKNAEYNNRPEIKERNLARRSDSEARERKRAYDNERYKQPEIQESKIAYAREYYAQPENQVHIKAYRKERYAQPEARARRQAYLREKREQPGFKERRNTYLKEYRQRPETQDHLQSYFHGYYRTPQCQAYRKEYRASPEGKALIRKNIIARRARKRNVPGSHTSQQILELLKRQRYRCYYCSKHFEKHKGEYVYHIEHTFPLSRVEGMGIPANDISYIVLACKHCNLSKHDKFPWEWGPGGRLL